MNEGQQTTIDLARDVHLRLSGGALTPAIAKLYSQHTRLAARRPGLELWRAAEAKERLSDAAQLINAAFLKKEANDDDWHLGMRRAGEILEWLNHPQFQLSDIPTRLLAAATYQLAGYPAMASSLLERVSAAEFESRFIPLLLKADFQGLLQALSGFWKKNLDTVTILEGDSGGSDLSDHLVPESLLVEQVSACLGIFCAEARWGGEQRIQKALEILHDASAVILHAGDTYSWILSKLVLEIGRGIEDRLLRSHLIHLESSLNEDGRKAMELYARYAYKEQRSVIWPSQAMGLNRLRADESFALCTPTGSGKTAVAEIALLQSLFREHSNSIVMGTTASSSSSPLAIYLVPSRALAAEAESKLDRILSRVSSPNDRITVTGLYGGSDWGPTDAWLTRQGKTVLICTYEKAEAILRFLGPLFLNRLRLVVIDEAHAVAFDGRQEELQRGENRSLRLESLGCRLLSHIARNDTKVIALSAVAGGIENTIASWVSGKDSEAEASSYRSTRQLIGRLECLDGRRFAIRYDLLDGRSLAFSERGESNTPFVNDPFPPFPSAPKLEEGGPEKRLRPYLFWAALHLVQPTTANNKSTVLVFIPQQIGGYAQDLLSLLDRDWAQIELPHFFEPPLDDERVDLWQRCVDSCLDYFTEHSREYRLLQRGVVVHHGRMPRLLSRLLVEVIEQGIVNVVLSTSTLAEGVNLPFEVLLVPSLRRGQTDVPIREFRNLAGRTGRPGVATEGRTLVLLPPEAKDWSSTKARERYFKTIGFLNVLPEDTTQGFKGSSPLAELLMLLRKYWEQIAQNSDGEFSEWLASIHPIEVDGEVDPAVQALDTLDSFLLSAIVELEQLQENPIAPSELEGQLREIWRRTFAFYSSSEESILSTFFVSRGKALTENVYPQEGYRRRLYKTSMPPRSAQRLMELCSEARKLFESGSDYLIWPRAKQFSFVRQVVDLVRSHPSFRTPETLGKAKNAPRWDQVLEWWLNRNSSERSPQPTQISKWYDFVYYHFDYRFNWGLSSILSLMFDEVSGDSLQPLTFEEWPKTGLPWIVFWIKELIIWGTLDPVATFLLSKRIAWTREQAETLSKEYYETRLVESSNDLLHPTKVLEWVEEGQMLGRKQAENRREVDKFDVELLRDFSGSDRSEWIVLPTEHDSVVLWLDASGSPMARSARPQNWDSTHVSEFDFKLHSGERVVRASYYV